MRFRKKVHVVKNNVVSSSRHRSSEHRQSTAARGACLLGILRTRTRPSGRKSTPPRKHYGSPVTRGDITILGCDQLLSVPVEHRLHCSTPDGGAPNMTAAPQTV